MVPAPPPDAQADLVDYEELRLRSGFVLRALRRHPAVALLSFLAVAGAAALGLLTLPRTWHAETKILAQRNQVMPALGNPGRAIPRDADAPTRAASETVLRRDNLLALVKQTSLVEHWTAHRAPAVRLKDAVVEALRGPPTQEDRVDALIALLEKQLRVTADEGTVTLAVDWTDPQMAFRLIEAAQQDFIETRHALEVSTIAEAISILEWHASDVHRALQSGIDELSRRRGAAPGAPASRAPLPRAATAPTPSTLRPARDSEQAQVRALLAAKQRAIADLEDFRRRRQAELQARLAEQRAVYAPAHPLLASTEESLAALQMDSPQLAALKKEELGLAAELTTRDEAAPDSARAEATAPAAQIAREAKLALDGAGSDPSTEYLRTQLRIATTKYEDLLGRIDAARIELDTARAAFKYRYSVVRPAQIPKTPESPNAPLVALAALLGGAALALFAAAAADLRGGRLVEAWQIERRLGLPLLGEVKRS